MQPWYVRKAKEKSGSIHRAGIRQKGLGAAVARCPRTLPGTSLGCWSYRCWNYRWYLQAPSGPDSWYISGAGSTPRGRLEIPLLGPGAARSPQLPWEGSGQQHTMHLTTRCFTEHSHPFRVFNGPSPLSPPHRAPQQVDSLVHHS